ncbi:receptor-like protein 2 [Prunus persica]|uniref:receptor-like protein 2 n=1 Tax=Prunus persica TaxID=3760 RepID=UPI0009AB9099|nr:receptor-like protein 2 [Prunus persica]
MLVSEQAAAQVDHNFLELPIFIQPDGAQALQYTYLSFLPPSIYLHNNSISGSIPVEIGGLQLLHALDLSNNFSGEIPDQISNLKNMDTVDLSVNHLSGKIPTSLRSLNFLSFFNVSYNNLEGQYQQVLSSKASMPLHLRGTRNFVVPPHPNGCLGTNGIDAGNKVIRIIKMWTMGTKSHGFIFPLRLDSLWDFGEFVVP